MVQKRRKKKQQRKLLSRKNLPILGVTVLFCTGIMAGAFSLDHIYQRHIENARLAQAEQAAAERAQAIVAQKKSRLIELKKQREKQAAQQLAATQKPNKTKATAKEAPKKVAFSSYIPAASSQIVAIVIDDIGYQRQEGERTLALPAKLTVAVLPFTPFAKSLAKQAPAAGKEVMLHAPMEPKKLSYWGDGLKASMPEQALRESFNSMINDIPNLVGINNHMGSGLTENAEIMAWLMAELPARGLYFIDSRTTAASAAYDAAKKLGIPTYERDIFLDHSRKPKDISRQLDKLVQTAQKNGMALGIGHPYPETLQVLEQRLPQLHAQGIELVTVSELLNARADRVQLALQTNKHRGTPKASVF